MLFEVCRLELWFGRGTHGSLALPLYTLVLYIITLAAMAPN